MKIGIASDHKGFLLKEKIKKVLEKEGYQIIDLGTTTEERTDYTKYAFLLTESVNKKEVDFGIAICGTGIGMSIACNKIKGIYCAKINDIFEARFAKEHNHANVIAISSHTNIFKTIKMIKTFINTKESMDEVHLNRINKIKEIENND